jgi:membrane-bound lytic murein transglycosylase F
VKRLPLLSQKNYYSRLKYGFARGHEAYAYVENIRKYHISLVGYLSEKERRADGPGRTLSGGHAG